jgi:excisionase family DNA binding protein
MDEASRSALTARPSGAPTPLTDDGLPTWWTGTHADLASLWNAFAENVAHVEHVSSVEAVFAWPAALLALMEGTIAHAARPPEGSKALVSDEALRQQIEVAVHEAVERLLPAAVRAASIQWKSEMTDTPGAREPVSSPAVRSVYLDVPAAAEYLGISMPSIRMRVARRTIPFIKDGRRVKFNRTALDKYMRTKSVPAWADIADTVAERVRAVEGVLAKDRTKPSAASKGRKPWKFRSS